MNKEQMRKLLEDAVKFGYNKPRGRTIDSKIEPLHLNVMNEYINSQLSAMGEGKDSKPKLNDIKSLMDGAKQVHQEQKEKQSHGLSTMANAQGVLGSSKIIEIKSKEEIWQKAQNEGDRSWTQAAMVAMEEYAAQFKPLSGEGEVEKVGLATLIDRAIVCGIESVAFENWEDRAKHVENFKKSLPTSGMPEGMKWVKASERLPEKPQHWPYTYGTVNDGEPPVVFVNHNHSACFLWYHSIGWPLIDQFKPYEDPKLYDKGWTIEDWYWLDEGGK